jgi:hypothetical protein
MNEVIGKYEPATGPWRYDTDNAPIDTQLLCWQWTPEGCDYHAIGMRKLKDGRWECGSSNDDCFHEPPIAFATLNAPEPSAGEE